MATTHKIATLNINGLSSHTRIAMLGDFIRKQEIDIILLQEVMQPVLGMIRGYIAHVNIGTNGRGTAILMREHIPLTNIMRPPSGRGMTADTPGSVAG